jgi:hypothetical protein
MPSNLIFLLSCQHTLSFHRDNASPAHELGEERYCPRCVKYVTVISLTAQYNVKCLGCHWAYSYGAALLLAQRSADKHQRNHPTHTIQVRQGQDIIEVRPAHYREVPIPFPIDTVPF